ncbi:hypothetical protein GCM10017750_50180 [Streptomyces racemochromogenes]
MATTDRVRIPIEMTYRRWRPRTSSARPIRAPVIRKTSAPFRFVRCMLHRPISPPDTPGPDHSTVRRARRGEERGCPPNGSVRNALYA